ncbi:MAG: ATP-binding protein [Caldisericia bacterium]|jgi:two-component system sensor histidine kinase AtoS|nr:ATP-binding protein [Caldisericia bacterium]
MKFFNSLRFQVIISFFIVVIVSTFLLGSIMIKTMEDNLWKAEEEKLTTVAKQLEIAYTRIIERLITTASIQKIDLNTAKRLYLERSLEDYTYTIHEQNPMYGVGYFIYGDYFNRPVAFYESSSTFSEKYRVILTLYEFGEEAGYVWVEEPKEIVTSKISQLKLTQRNILYVVVLISGIFAIYISAIFVRKVTVIKRGLENLKLDLSYKLPKMTGEMGEISFAINDLAQTLLVTRSNSEKILETINTGVLVITKDGIIKDLNRAFEKLLDLKKKDILEKNINSIPILKEIILELFNKGKLKEKRVKIQKEEKIFNIFSTTFNTDEILITFEDVTEEVKLLEEKRRTEALKTLGIFTTGVAHEIRNPLTAIKGFTQILEKKFEKDSDELKYTRTILNEVKRLEDIIKDLLMYGRPSPPNKVLSHISSVIKDSISLLQEKISEKNMNIELDINFDPKFNFDPKQMEQVLLNLILNAIESSDYNGKIIIKTKRYEDGILIEVRDFGFGIKEEDKEKIFTPFFTTKEKGTGLGLPISQKLVEMHNGKIWFNSDQNGTSFFVYLPIN